MKKVEVKVFLRYSNHSIKDNGIVSLCFKAQYSQLSKIVLCSQMLNENVSIKSKLNNKVISLGEFRIKRILVDGDGESKLLLSSSSDFINLENLNKIAIESDGEEFNTSLAANIDEEKEEE